MVNVLVLILANDSNPFYCELQHLWRTYMNKYPNVKCLFYKAHPQLQVDYVFQDANTLIVKCDETLESVWEKTLKAFQIVEPHLGSFDYVFRPNLSSFVYFPAYLDFIDSFPRKECCVAYTGVHDGIKFPAGAGFTLSTDLVKRLVHDPPEFVCQDDVTIGRALRNWKIGIYEAPRIDILCPNDHSILTENIIETCQFHFRLKDAINRIHDIHVFKRLLKLYYNILLE